MFRFANACLVLTVCSTNNMLAQTERPRFEVASVRRAGEGEATIYNPGPGTFQAHSVPMRILIQIAYRVKDFQVIGEPSWFTEEPYSIDAKIPAGARDAAAVRVMLQNLLADRFHLKIRHESKD